MLNTGLTRNWQQVSSANYFAPMMKRATQDPHLAQAMKILRMKAGKSLKEIEPSVGVTRQAVSRWENESASFPEDKVPLYLRAIGKTQADLDKEILGLSEDGPSYTGPGAYSDFAALLKQQVIDESMSPWVEPGEWVWYQQGLHPRRSEGCVVELVDGTLLVRLYLREKDGYVFLQRINPESVEQYLHSDVKAIHKVKVRGN